MKPSETAMVHYEEPLKPPALTNSWPSGLSIEVGLNSLAVGAAVMDDEDLCKQFELTQIELDNIRAHPAFRAEVREAIGTIKENYGTIRRKARMSFEFYMDECVPKLISDPQVSGDVKLKVIQYLGKVAGLDAADKLAEAEATKAATQSNQAAAQPSINIILTSAPTQPPPSVTIEQTAERVS